MCCLEHVKFFGGVKNEKIADFFLSSRAVKSAGSNGHFNTVLLKGLFAKPVFFSVWFESEVDGSQPYYQNVHEEVCTYNILYGLWDWFHGNSGQKM